MTQVLLLLILMTLLFGGAKVLGFLEAGLFGVAAIAVIAILVFILKLVFQGLFKGFFTAAADFFTDVRDWFRFLIKNWARLPYWLGLIFWFPYRILWRSIGAFRANEGGARDKFWDGFEIFMAFLFSALFLGWELLLGAVLILFLFQTFGVDLISR
jgi:hypothetical protein